ncbi:GNAT family N-acetyltransferase [Parasedimentitalea maritima]|uniref:GNAT family N-acetyltransferase n=1 Tax=Parasedimentitalea maritima TaxID=2578117 RepID=A0A6A4RBW1_9RHOB|nr:GNAT family N-acetyltransferase [Zongyanglinia marina]KAE9626548.1 GNAT family N-acetyltransferase [Zongyanglinia marina]
MFDFMPADVRPRPIQRSIPIRAMAQSQEFTRAVQLRGQKPLVLDQLGDTVVMQQRFWGRVDVAMVNRAQITKPLRLLELLQENGLRRTPVILSPQSLTPDLAKLGAVPLISPAQVAQLELTTSKSERRAALHQKWRNRLNHAESQNLRVKCENMPLDPDHWLLQADAKQQGQRGYRNWPIDLTLAYAHENPGKAKLFQAFEGREVIAAVLILCHGNSATYHISHSTDRGRSLSAHNLLMWKAMNRLAAQDYLQLDLGLINTEDAAGLARFKLGTGAKLHSLGGTWAYWPPMGRLLGPLAALDRRLMTPRKTGQA